MNEKKLKPQLIANTLNFFNKQEVYFIYPDNASRRRLYIANLLGDSAIEAMVIFETVSDSDRDLRDRLIEQSEDILAAEGQVNLDAITRRRLSLAVRKNNLEKILSDIRNKRDIDQQG